MNDKDIDSPIGTEPSHKDKAVTPLENSLRPNYGEKKTGESQNLAGVPAEFMNLFEHDPSEVILLQALRHPLGVIFIYGAAIGATVLIVILMGLLASDGSLGTSLSNTFYSVMVLVGIVFIAITAVVAFAAAYVYKKSRMILTNQKVVYIQYHSLFSREVSQLNIGEVEDVNVAQKTLWDRIFKAGVITIETAGEQNNYVMSHVEDPHAFAQKTIQAHEGSIAEYGN